MHGFQDTFSSELWRPFTGLSGEGHLEDVGLAHVVSGFGHEGDSAGERTQNPSPVGPTRVTTEPLGRRRKECLPASTDSGGKPPPPLPPRRRPANPYLPPEMEGNFRSTEGRKVFRREEAPFKNPHRRSAWKPGPAKVLLDGVVQDVPKDFLGPRPQRRAHRSVPPNHAAAPAAAPTPARVRAPTATPDTPVSRLSHMLYAGIAQRSIADKVISVVDIGCNVKDDPQPLISRLQYNPRSPQSSEKETERQAAAPHKAKRGGSPIILTAARSAITGLFRPAADAPAHPKAPKLTHPLCPGPCPRPPSIAACDKLRSDVSLPGVVSQRDAQWVASRPFAGVQSSFSPQALASLTTRRQLSARSRLSAMAVAAGLGDSPLDLSAGQRQRSSDNATHSPPHTHLKSPLKHKLMV